MKTSILFPLLFISLISANATRAISIENYSLHLSNISAGPNGLVTLEKPQEHAESHSRKSLNKEEVGLDEFDNLHPLVVHFPIVLLLFAALLQCIQLFVLKRDMDWVILFIIGTGFIGAYVAGTYVHPHTHGLTDIAQKVLDNHDKYADWTIWSSAFAAVLKIISLFWIKLNRGFEIAILVVMAFSAFSVAQAGHYGAQLVYIQGVGPQGQFLETEEAEEGSHSH
tara:strand:+ start:7453 stop:8127 length:675 start_codon:yes stop_codon:yes gene_type:complete